MYFILAYMYNYFNINIFHQNVDVLKDQEAVKQLASILKTNVRACKALGHPYVIQLGKIYLDMLNVYKVQLYLYVKIFNTIRIYT